MNFYLLELIIFSTTNKQYYPGTSLDKVVQIGTMSDLGIANPGSTQKLIASGQGAYSNCNFS